MCLCWFRTELKTTIQTDCSGHAIWLSGDLSESPQRALKIELMNYSFKEYIWFILQAVLRHDLEEDREFIASTISVSSETTSKQSSFQQRIIEISPYQA